MAWGEVSKAAFDSNTVNIFCTVHTKCELYIYYLCTVANERTESMTVECLHLLDIIICYVQCTCSYSAETYN